MCHFARAERHARFAFLLKASDWPRRRPKAFNRNAKRAGRHARFAFLLKASGLVDGQKPSVETQSARRKTRFGRRRGQKPSLETQSARIFRRALCVSIEGFCPSTRPEAFNRNAKRACPTFRRGCHFLFENGPFSTPLKSYRMPFPI